MTIKAVYQYLSGALLILSNPKPKGYVLVFVLVKYTYTKVSCLCEGYCHIISVDLPDLIIDRFRSRTRTLTRRKIVRRDLGRGRRRVKCKK